MMAVIEYWIQLEVRDWDTQPKGINRMDTSARVQPAFLLRCRLLNAGQ